jgi:hypothetical protein
MKLRACSRGARRAVPDWGGAFCWREADLPDVRWVPTGSYGTQVSETSRSDVPSKGMRASPDEFEPDPGAIVDDAFEGTPTEPPLDTVQDHTTADDDEDWFVIQF